MYIYMYIYVYIVCIYHIKKQKTYIWYTNKSTKQQKTREPRDQKIIGGAPKSANLATGGQEKLKTDETEKTTTLLPPSAFEAAAFTEQSESIS